MRANPRLSLSLALALGGLLAMTGLGCGGSEDTLPREAVSGTVAFDGKPLAQGTIQFMPTAQGEGGAATAGSGIITDGKYSIPKDQGLIAGGYKVVISSAPPGSDAPAEEMPGMAPPPPKDLIPAKYNANTTLNAEIKAGTNNVVDFDLKK
jgi:hypothetical protein